MHPSRRTIQLALLTGLVLGANGSAAREAKAPPPPNPAAEAYGQTIASAPPVALLFSALDSNGDARTDAAELDSGLARLWPLADTNRDGTISLTELADWAQAWLGDRNARPGRFEFDPSNDDRISRDEFDSTLRGAFRRFDRDGDKALDRTELLVSSLECAPQRDGERAAKPGDEARGGSPAPLKAPAGPCAGQPLRGTGGNATRHRGASKTGCCAPAA